MCDLLVSGWYFGLCEYEYLDGFFVRRRSRGSTIEYHVMQGGQSFIVRLILVATT